MAGPITPEEVVEKQEQIIPEEVFQAFNNLIAKNWNGSRSTFKKEDAIQEILKTPPKLLTCKPPAGKRQTIISERWLDIETVYRSAGWKVVYDAPGYNENYDATFEFSKK